MAESPADRSRARHARFLAMCDKTLEECAAETLRVGNQKPNFTGFDSYKHGYCWSCDAVPAPADSTLGLCPTCEERIRGGDESV